MSSSCQIPSGRDKPIEDALCSLPAWYAVHTRSRHEKQVSTQLEIRGVDTFLPLVKQVRHWSDRRKVVELPLFPGYSFVRVGSSPEDQVRVLKIDGVVAFVGIRGRGIPIPEKQIEDIRQLLMQNVPCVNHPFLRVGQRVRIRGGALDGVTGILIDKQGDHRLVISVEPIERSFSIRLEGYDVEVL